MLFGKRPTFSDGSALFGPRGHFHRTDSELICTGKKSLEAFVFCIPLTLPVNKRLVARLVRKDTQSFKVESHVIRICIRRPDTRC